MIEPTQTPETPPPRLPAEPVLRPEGRRGHSRFLLLVGGGLAALILLRVATTHPFPPPSHQSSTAAVAGYLAGLEHHDLSELRSYLAPAQRAKASGLLQAFATHHVYISGPAASGVSQVGNRATVIISLEVCFPLSGTRADSCESVDREPLGLPDQLTCIKVNGGWYVTTLFKPS
ncbi:MAG TPA: hypothetical protein VNH38_06755 [Candidatus Dormibacteraeota bacterium]|nr:hypothetical protein [Candidatus Dormibacteraeota bacterium]